MNAVLGLLELELRRPGDRASTVRSLGTAHEAARDLLGMIDDILDMAKIEARRLELAPAPFELGAWVQGVVAIYEPAARGKGVALSARMLGARERAWVSADALRLRQVLGNLLSNAIKFTDAGEVMLEYSIGEARVQERVESGGRVSTGASLHRELLLAVTDTGIGIAADQQALLFAPFVQARQARPGRFGGTGLGLSICRKLMTMMGGTIELSSMPGRGSRFTVRVCLPVAEAPQEVTAGAFVGDVAMPVLAGLRVLVVDDHPANRMLLSSQLTTLGCAMEIVNDGEAAFASWDEQRVAGTPYRLDPHRLFDARDERRRSRPRDPCARVDGRCEADAHRRRDGKCAAGGRHGGYRGGHDAVPGQAAWTRRTAAGVGACSARESERGGWGGFTDR